MTDIMGVVFEMSNHCTAQASIGGTEITLDTLVIRWIGNEILKQLLIASFYYSGFLSHYLPDEVITFSTLLTHGSPSCFISTASRNK